MGIILDNGQALASDDLSNQHLVGLHRILHKKKFRNLFGGFSDYYVILQPLLKTIYNLAMLQSRMNILTTSIRGNKCFERMSYVHTLSIESIGLTFQQTYKSIGI